MFKYLAKSSPLLLKNLNKLGCMWYKLFYISYSVVPYKYARKVNR